MTGLIILTIDMMSHLDQGYSLAGCVKKTLEYLVMMVLRHNHRFILVKKSYKWPVAFDTQQHLVVVGCLYLYL